MSIRNRTLASVALLGTGLLAASAFAQTSVISYGRITAVRQVDLQNQGAQTTGALVGGLLGVASGSGQSSSNRALRGLGGAAVGGRVAGAAGSSTGFEYTILINGTNTIRMVTNEGGLRTGDCVSVERGQFNNLRLVDDARCNTPTAPASRAATGEADACAAATRRSNSVRGNAGSCGIATLSALLIAPGRGGADLGSAAPI
jgi:outer membrane lipoprotein SlyB